ncbi:SpoIIE family protein phosphatase [Streptomyces cucumeris]|uniref:SpoIIE family protein phosphatase n=1 Tax=Streptomyces cucumeris TaxID=2962890 RepID=UPI003D714DF4
MVSTDSMGRITAWSADAERLLGYAPEEILGTYATGLLAAKLPVAALRSFVRRREWSGGIAARHRYGQGVPLTVHASPAQGTDGEIGWIVMASSAEPVVQGTAAPALASWVLEQLPVAVAFHDRQNRMVSASHLMLMQMGMTAAQQRGRPLREFSPGETFDTTDALTEEVLRTGKPHVQELFNQAPGEIGPRAHSLYITPVKDPDGQICGATVTVIDTSPHRKARQRLALVNDASTRIGSTLRPDRTAQELADVSCGDFADFVCVDLLEPVLQGDEPNLRPEDDGVTLYRAGQASVLDGHPESLTECGRTSRYRKDTPPAEALVQGRSSRHRLDDPRYREWVASLPGGSHMVETHGISSVMMVPLRARGITLGLAVFLRHRNPELFDEDDLLLAEEIAARAAVCIDNARRYTAQRNTALTLQRNLLPRHLPHEPALEVASRYLPADPHTGIGGDWYDVIPLSGARVALVVGDVVGRGIQASATMGRLRTAVRTLADVDLPPDELLTHLDDIILHHDVGLPGRSGGPGSDDMWATCLYAVYDPITRRCSVARAGHPAPVLVAPDGTVEVPDLPAGPPLGMGGLPFETTELELPENCLITLYTNGLVQSRRHDVESGLRRLGQALHQSPGRPLEEVCDTVLDTVLLDEPDDDVALLVARPSRFDASQVATLDVPPEPSAVSPARQWAGTQLTAWELDDAAFVTELVVSELVTNAIRYGQPPIQLRLIRTTSLICEVTDSSNTAPHLRRARIYDEGGRGLLLVAQLSQRWGTRHTTRGKTIWSEQALPEPFMPTTATGRA